MSLEDDPHVIPPPSEDPAQAVVEHALELRDAGREDWLEHATRDCPELASQVAAAVRTTDQMNALFSDSTVTALTGTTLEGRFRIGACIGAGAMGVVHRAEDLKLVRSVAVKVLRGGVFDKERSVRRFLREAEAMASVQHPAVVTVYDHGQFENSDPYIVMEFVDGVPLSSIVEDAAERVAKGAPLDAMWLAREFGIVVPAGTGWTELAVTWAAELAAGLEVVHEAGVLHRDIKPSNVLVRRDGHAVLLDFGLALLDDDSTLTRGQTSVGTPVYMPPEALERGVKRGPTTDVYSLCATLYHLVTLEQPYSGLPTEVLAALATREPEPVRSVRPGLSRDLAAIVEMGMERKAKTRYASAALLEADLQAFLDRRAVVARPITPLRRGLRRAARSFALRGAVAAAVLIGAVAGAQQWNAARDASRAARDFAIRQQLPPGLNVVGVTNRVYRYDSDRDDVRALLDEGVAIGKSPVAMPMLRACFRLDHGDPQGAAEDMARVAREVDSPYTRALAERYAALPADADVMTRIELTDLPAPESPADFYVAGYHAARNDDVAETLRAFSEEGVGGFPYVVEFQAGLVPYGRMGTEERIATAIARLDKLGQLEESQGGPTASSRSKVGFTLGMLQRYREGYNATLEALELSTRDYTIQLNAGYLAMRLGDYVAAEEHLTVAVDLRPNYFRPLWSLVWCILGTGDFDKAQAILKAAPLDPTPLNEVERRELGFAIEVQRLLAAKYADDLDKATVAAAEDLAKNARRRLSNGEEGLDLPSDIILAALLSDDNNMLFKGLTQLYLEDPNNTWLLQQIARHLPQEFDSKTIKIAGVLIESFVPLQLR